ncbi:MAG: TRAP transporter fused permease subunit [Alphaproteobacteria bacterium]|nr:TRAP transporter fused permease subunit [Alphaproteobacteria bacterium]
MARDGAMLAAAALSVGFHLYLIFSGLIPGLVTRPLHLALALPWVFVFSAKGTPAARAVGYGACALGIAFCLYIAWNRRALTDQYGSLDGPFQYLLAICLILIVLEMARRAIKPILPGFAVIVLAYGLFGQHLPGELGHPGFPLDGFLGTLVIAEGGLWGQLTDISVTLVAPFVVLGAFVTAGEAGTGFMALATQLAGRFRAGAAKVSVLASAMYGTISGSASANVASVGTITIPAMKRMGYPPAFAGAVEAVASTGGQIMPPVMGAGAFLMAELLRVTYADVMIAATLPALLFFFTAWAGVHHYASGHGLKGMAAHELPGWPLVIRTVPFFLVPFGILVALLLTTGYTAPFGAAIATCATALLVLIDDRGRISLTTWLRRTRSALIDAAEQIAMIAAIIICAGLIVGVFAMTGIGVKITSLILGLSGGSLWGALFLTAIACIFLGMEVPTTAAYIICVSVAGPALVKLGLPPLHAHMFVFWYALLSTITPPVCGTVYIAAGIAETPWLGVANRAVRLGLGLFVVPLGFVANPALLALADAPILAWTAAIKLAVGVWLLSYAAIEQIGRATVIGLARRALALVAGAGLIFTFGI